MFVGFLDFTIEFAPFSYVLCVFTRCSIEVIYLFYSLALCS